MFSRRGLITSALSTLATSQAQISSWVADAKGLAAQAAAHGRFYGAAIRADQLDSEQDLRNAILRECSHIVPETELKWAAIEPSSGVLSFEKADAIAAFAVTNGKKVRGHTLIWHRSVPSWAEHSLRENHDWTIIDRYFGSIVPRYGDIIEQWDVINEPIATGQRMDGLRQNIFLEAFGPEYIDRALITARKFAPRARLLINEFGLEYDLPLEKDRRYLLLKLLERLKSNGVPLDGLGLQAHLDLGKGHVSQTALSSFVKEVTSLGLLLVVTELDVKESNYAAPVELRDRLVAEEVRRYLDVVLSSTSVVGVATWGISDRHSWLGITARDYARFPGAWLHGIGPGLNRGLPFDSSMRKKPMYDALSASFIAG